MGGSSGGGGTQVVRPQPWGPTGQQMVNIYDQAQKMYERGPTPMYPGSMVARQTPGETAAQNYLMTQAPQLGAMSMHGMRTASGLTDTGNKYLGMAPGMINLAGGQQFNGYGNTGNWRDVLQNQAPGRMDQRAGEYATLHNIGDWQGTVGQQSTGQINPYVDYLANAASNQAFRGAERAAGLTQDTFNLSAQRARDELDRAQVSGLNAYERATLPIRSDLEDYLATAGRDFTETVLPALRGNAALSGAAGGSRDQLAQGLAGGRFGEAMARNIGRAGEAMGLGAAQLGSGLGLATSQLSSNLGLGARQGAMDVYRLGSQAAEQSGDIAANLYGGAFENAQGRALQAAGLGQAGDIAQAGYQQQGIQNQRAAFENAQQRSLQAANLGLSAEQQQAALQQQELQRIANLGLGAAQAGSGMVSTGLGAMPSLTGAALSPYGQLANLGQQQRALEQQKIAEQVQRYQYPYTSGWENVGNYANIIGGLGTGTGGSSIPYGTSPFAGAIGGGLAGAGTGYLIGNVPGAIIGGGLGALGGFL